MRPSLWVVLVVVGIPYGGAIDLVWEVLVRTELVVQRGMLAGGLYSVGKDGAGHLFLD